MGMKPQQKAEHILKVCSDTLTHEQNKKEALEWVKNQHGKPVHKWLNSGGLNQEQINQYWHKVSEIIKSL